MESLMKTLIENLTQDKVREEKYLKEYENELAKFSIKYYSGSQLFEYSGTTDIRFIPPLEGLID